MRHSERTSEARIAESVRDLGDRREELLAASCLAGLKALASERRRFGYRRLHTLLKREEVVLNHKKLFPASTARNGQK